MARTIPTTATNSQRFSPSTMGVPPPPDPFPPDEAAETATFFTTSWPEIVTACTAARYPGLDTDRLYDPLTSPENE